MINSSFTVTLCASAHVELESDRNYVVHGSTVSEILPIDPVLGIGSSIIYLKDGTSLNVLQTPGEIIAQNVPWN